MSLRSITVSLEKLTILHGSLLELSKQKSEVIKKGATDELQKLLVNERKHVQALEQAEAKRQEAVSEWLKHQDRLDAGASITEILESPIDPLEKQQLEDAAVQLTNKVMELKQQEQLNQSLIRQSMQFVELSLDLMKPTIQSFNYGGNKPAEPNRSVFDSKA